MHMRWKFLDPDLAPFGHGMPELPQTALVMAPVADYRHELMAEEAGETERMAEIRQFGFSSGRHCAHLAQALLDLPVQAIGREDRVPVWPAHSKGSITHSAKVAAAMASTGFKGVGVDIEQTGRVDEKLYRMLFTEAEQGLLGDYGFDAATVAFSAKEAGYKAIYPIGQQFVGFQEAEIHLAADSNTFTIEYIGEHAPNRALNEGQGYWCEHDGQVMTIFLL